MRELRFEKTSSTSIRVERNGRFVGWLTKSTHKPTGLTAQRYMVYEGHFRGVRVRENTLGKCRLRISTILEHS